MAKRSLLRIFFSTIFCLVFINPVWSYERLILEPVVQGIVYYEPIDALQDNQKYYIEIEEFAKVVGISLNKGKNITGYFLDPENKFEIKPEDVKKEDFIFNGENIYFSTDFYQKTFPLQIEVDSFEMLIKIDSEKKLPVMIKAENLSRRNNIQKPQDNSFKDYKFDNRYFSTPVADLSYTKGFSKNNNGSFDSDYYQLDLSMLALGLDTTMTVFDNHSPYKTDTARYRFLAERTFLDEPTNAINLKQFKMGDITSFQSNLVDSSSGGRGVYMSSFKDLVMSADKTIDINGALTAGWEVELYQNDQLIGFRQSSMNGRYEFGDIPVRFGLNVFKLVFYGPYGETRTEEKRYYSGTSPVKAGELGYNLNLYQKNRYLIEQNEELYNKTDEESYDATFYYGLHDNMSLIGGQSRTVNVYDNNKVRNFSNLGVQTIWSGASVQYNTLYSSDNKEFGHHADVQGNVYIGDIFARYEYYGKLESPISFYNDVYLKDLVETRLSGSLYKLNIPYYLSYKVMNSHQEETFKEISARLSPNFGQYYNLTVENVWQSSLYNKFNYIDVLLNAQYGQLGLSLHAQYYTMPETQLNNFGGKIDYRMDRNTYWQFDWHHYNSLKNKKHFYYLDDYTYASSQNSFDVFTLSAGRLFDFGGLTLSLSADTNDNYAAYLTYNISIGKVPERNEFFSNAQTKMSDMGSVMVRVKDENDTPVENAKIWVTGTEKPLKTNMNGELLITDIQPYEKTSLNVMLDEINDISLYPEKEEYKMVFRPGTVQTFDIILTHKGGIEGQIDTLDKNKTYLVKLLGKKSEAKTYSDDEGFFIFDDIKYGNYELKVYDEESNLLAESKVKIDNPLVTIDEKIVPKETKKL